MQNPGMCPALWVDFYGQNPAHILAGKCEITQAGLGMESNAPQHHGTAGAILSIALKSLCVHAIPSPVGAVVTNDWCIMIGH